MRIFIGRFGHECNTMASGLTEYGYVLQNGDWQRGDEVLSLYRGTPEYLGGIIDCGMENGVELTASISTEVASPPLSRDCLESCMSALLEDLCRCADSIDGICFVLHGAGCAEGVDDLETYVLRRFREIVGDDMPITVPLDLHGNLSVEMTRLADGFFGVKEYPHTDAAEAGRLAMQTLIDCIRSGRRCRTAYVRLPLLMPLASGYTRAEPLLSINRHIADCARSHGLIDAALFHGFPYADVDCCAASVLAVSYGDPLPAARELAEYVWSRRDELAGELIAPAEALELAAGCGGAGYVLMSEASDNPGGGAPGDGTHLLREMLARNLPGSAFMFIYDPEAAKKISAVGVGGRVDIELGGRIEAAHGAPVSLKNAEVIALSDGETVCSSPMMLGVPRPFGKSAMVRCGNVDVAVASVQRQTLDDSLFTALGADIGDYRVVAIKSTHHFRAFFQERAALIIPVETPGVLCSDLRSFTYKKLRRPVFPLDGEL